MVGQIGQIGRIGAIGLAPSQGAGGFTPLALGAALYDQWDAEETAKLTLASAAVSAWASSKNSYPASQAASNAKPTYGATSFNGRPGVTFDGVDDVLVYAGVGSFPINAVGSELWVLADQIALVSDTSDRAPFNYGASSAATTRTIRRRVLSGVNRAAATISASPASNDTVDFSGRHVLRMIINPDSVRMDVDGVAGTQLTFTPTTGAVRTVIGSGQAGSVLFFQGVVAYAAVTDPLNTTQAAQMLAYLKARGGTP